VDETGRYAKLARLLAVEMEEIDSKRPQRTRRLRMSCVMRLSVGGNRLAFWRTDQVTTLLATLFRSRRCAAPAPDTGAAQPRTGRHHRRRGVRTGGTPVGT
jgi:hypothetical protein